MVNNHQLSPKQLVKLYRQALNSGVSIEELEAKLNRKIQQNFVSQKEEALQEDHQLGKVKGRLPSFVRMGAMVIPVGLLVVGVFLLGNAVLPIAQYYATTLPNLLVNNLTTPVPAEEILDVTPMVIAQTEGDEQAVLGSSLDTGPVILDKELDYTNLSNWFGLDAGADLVKDNEKGVVYTLDIPELEISGAEVVIGGTNLDKSLIAFPGTAMPGDLGAPVIFGHSVLRQFYNPSQKNPRRYNSIFSYIMTLKTGDKIFLTQGDAKYTYVVRNKTEVKPEDTYILAQRYDVRQLKLVTCVPEGTYLRRGVVTAELVIN